jgi:hypothetical protein
MLTFRLCSEDDELSSPRTVHIAPAAVVSVEETEARRAYGG